MPFVLHVCHSHQLRPVVRFSIPRNPRVESRRAKRELPCSLVASISPPTPHNSAPKNSLSDNFWNPALSPTLEIVRDQKTVVTWCVARSAGQGSQDPALRHSSRFDCWRQLGNFNRDLRAVPMGFPEGSLTIHVQIFTSLRPTRGVEPTSLLRFCSKRGVQTRISLPV
jgi:hypothetical protein